MASKLWSARSQSIALLLVGACPALAACSSPPTAGTRVTLQSWWAGPSPEQAQFETSQGWSVELTRAQLGVESIYYVTGAAVGGELSKKAAAVSVWTSLWSWFGVSSAHAHPGHYAAGDTLGEMTRFAVLDLLGPAQALQTSDGVSGTARSGILRFASLSASDASAVYLEGLATNGESSVQFSANASLQELANSASSQPEVPGIVLTNGQIAENGRISLQVSPSVWLDQVHFEPLLHDAAARVPLEPGTPAHNALVRGMKKSRAYTLSFEPDPETDSELSGEQP